MIYHDIKALRPPPNSPFGKISAQPHTTLCIQFLTRENNKKQYISIGKTDLFYNSMGLCGNFTAQVKHILNFHTIAGNYT